MNETMNQSGQQPATPTLEASRGQGERTFTQEEVNKIVSERLARDRADRAAPSPEDEREKALKAREARMDCREYLDAQGYPAVLLDVLDCSDTAKFKASVDKLVKAFPAITGKIIREGWKPGEGSRLNSDPDPIAAAFKPKI